MAKKIKLWGKIKLLETSVVGIPAYPDAHLSTDSFSLIKAVKGFSDQLNLKETDKMPEEETTQETSEVETPVENSESEQESSNEESESNSEESNEEESNEESESEETEQPAIDEKAVKEIFMKAIKDSIKELSTERGLVSKEEQLKEVVKKASTGELALSMGLFSVPKAHRI